MLRRLYIPWPLQKYLWWMYIISWWKLSLVYRYLYTVKPDNIRNPTLEEIKTVLHEDSTFRWDDLSPELKMQIIMDIAKIQKTLNIKNDCEPNWVPSKTFALLNTWSAVHVYSKKKPVEIGEGITIVFGVMKGGEVRSNHIVSYYKYIYIN